VIHYDKGTQGSKTVVFGTRLEYLMKATELLLIGFLGSSAWANMELTLTKGGYGPLAR
jgi:hypothetical protein